MLEYFLIYIGTSILYADSFQRMTFDNSLYLTIIPRARMGSASIAHEAEGRIGYWLRDWGREVYYGISQISQLE